MKTLGVIALVLGLAFVIAGLVSYALDRREPGPDENAWGKSDEIGRDLFSMNDEPAEPALQPSGAVATDPGSAAANHTAGN